MGDVARIGARAKAGARTPPVGDYTNRNKGNSKGGTRAATVGRHSKECQKQGRQQEPPPVGDITRTEARATTRPTARPTARTEARAEARQTARTEQGRKPGRKQEPPPSRAIIDIVAGVRPFGGWRLGVPPFKPLRVICPPLSLFSLSLLNSLLLLLLLYIIIIIVVFKVINSTFLYKK